MMEEVNLEKLDVVKSYCVFCYKNIPNNSAGEKELGDTSNLDQTDKLEICEKFYKIIRQPLNHLKIKRKNVEPVVSKWDSEKIGVCSPCFYAVDSCNSMLEKMERLQRNLYDKMGKFRLVMKEAGKIKKRVKDFHGNLEGSEDRDSVVKFREKVYHHACRLTLKVTKSPVSRNKEDAVSDGSNGLSESLANNDGAENNGNCAENEEVIKLFDVIPISPIKRRENSIKMGHSESESEHLASQESHPASPITALDEQLDASQPGDQQQVSGYNSCSDSDPEVCKNWPRLKALVSSLRAHGAPDLQQTEESTVPISPSLSSSTCARKKMPALMMTLRNSRGNDEKRARTALETGGSENMQIPTEEKPETVKRQKVSVFKTKKGRRQSSEVAKIGGKGMQLEQPVSKIGDMENKLKQKIKKKTTLRKGKKKKSKNKLSMTCEICEKRFFASTIIKLETLMFRHLKKNALHGGQARWKHVCTPCNQIFRYEKELKNHVLKVHSHNEQDKRFSCAHCKVKFFQEKDLCAHFKTAHKELIVEETENVVKVESLVVDENDLSNLIQPSRDNDDMVMQAFDADNVEMEPTSIHAVVVSHA